MHRPACLHSNQRVNLFEQNARIFYRRAWDALDFKLDTEVAQFPKGSDVRIVHRNARGNLTATFGHMHIANIDLGDGNATTNKRQNIRWVINHQENQLIGRCLMNHIDGFLQREVPHCDALGSGHVHESLTDVVVGNAVIGDKNQICPDYGIPLVNNLPMDEPVIDTCQKNIRLRHATHSLQTHVARLSARDLTAPTGTGGQKHEDPSDG